jgi:iduronate 2-sulfatase
LELYDYETDPDEHKNLASERPEVASELRKILADQPEAKPQLGSRPARRQGAVAQGSRP